MPILKINDEKSNTADKKMSYVETELILPNYGQQNTNTLTQKHTDIHTSLALMNEVTL